jgi:hypothetical protein
MKRKDYLLETVAFRTTYFQEAIFSKQTAGTFQEVPSERGNHLKGRKFVSKYAE